MSGTDGALAAALAEEDRLAGLAGDLERSLGEERARAEEAEAYAAALQEALFEAFWQNHEMRKMLAEEGRGPGF